MKKSKQVPIRISAKKINVLPRRAKDILFKIISLTSSDSNDVDNDGEYIENKLIMCVS